MLTYVTAVYTTLHLKLKGNVCYGADTLSVRNGWVDPPLTNFKLGENPTTKRNMSHVTHIRSLVDLLVLAETWHTASDDNCLRLATRPGYATVDGARTSPIAVVFRQSWKEATFPHVRP